MSGHVIDRPGVIQHTGQMARLVFGELARKRTPRSEAFLAACGRAKTGFDAELKDKAVKEFQRVLEVDPETLAFSRLGGADQTAAMQRVSSAMRVGDDIWVSSNDDRIARLSLKRP